MSTGVIDFQENTILKGFEWMLGDRNQAENIFSSAHSLALDESETFPEAACQKLNQWGLHHFYVPYEWGGKLLSFETLFGLMRLLARRDLSIAIAHGKTYLGASCVWVAGEASQKKECAHLVLSEGIISLGLTEKNHGGDILANECEAEKVGCDYAISGEKWLINNAKRCDAMSVFAKIGHQSPSRDYALFLIEKKKIQSGEYFNREKIKTHGVRAAEITDICFSRVKVSQSACIGGEGKGLEVLLKSLQISRTLCASLSLGVVDSAFRSTLSFVYQRRLYGLHLLDIPHVQSQLLDSFFDLLVCEAFSLFAIRALHLFPERMSLYSSLVKYFVPTHIESIFDRLSGLLGARSYLREGHDGGLFQKLMRDHSLVSLFDGSTLVNLQNIANQINVVTKEKQHSDFSEKYKIACSLDLPLPPLNIEALSIFTHESERMAYLFEQIISEMEANFCLHQEHRLEILHLLKLWVIERDRLFIKISNRNYFYEKMNKEKEGNLRKYALIIAAAAYAGILHYSNHLSHSDLSFTLLLKGGLLRLLACFNMGKVASGSEKISLLEASKREGAAGGAALTGTERKTLLQSIKTLFDENRLFSLLPMELK